MRVLISGLVGTGQEIRDFLTIAFVGTEQVDRARLSNQSEGREVQIHYICVFCM